MSVTAKYGTIQSLFPILEIIRVKNSSLMQERAMSETSIYSVSTALREFSSLTGKTYKEWCSAISKLTKDTFDECHVYAKDRIKSPVDIITTPMTVNQMRDQVDIYMNLTVANAEEIQYETGEEGTERIIAKYGEILLRGNNILWIRIPE